MEERGGEEKQEYGETKDARVYPEETFAMNSIVTGWWVITYIFLNSSSWPQTLLSSGEYLFIALVQNYG